MNTLPRVSGLQASASEQAVLRPVPCRKHYFREIDGVSLCGISACLHTGSHTHLTSSCKNCDEPPYPLDEGFMAMFFSLICHIDGDQVAWRDGLHPSHTTCCRQAGLCNAIVGAGCVAPMVLLHLQPFSFCATENRVCHVFLYR